VEPSGLPVTFKATCNGGNYNVMTRQPGHDACGLLVPDAAFEQLREQLATHRRLLREWREHLAALERRASAQSIPHAWRR
jgi:DNA-binding transcriptional regulator/RsmH inhibitor MraZ